jgi:hypothetical protein
MAANWWNRLRPWVAHQKDIYWGDHSERCRLGYTFRVRVLADGCNDVPLQDVRSDDIWINDAEDHAGLVIRIMQNLDPHEMPEITMRHDSSRQHGVATNDFEHYFHGQGSFCR